MSLGLIPAILLNLFTPDAFTMARVAGKTPAGRRVKRLPISRAVARHPITRRLARQKRRLERRWT